MQMASDDRRILVTGVPRSGKTTLANKLGELARHSDDLFALEWSEQSRRVVAEEWMSFSGPWIIEGTTVIRALRKWLKANPQGKPCEVVYYSECPKSEMNKGQKSMGLWHSKIWAEIVAELQHRGCDIEFF